MSTAEEHALRSLGRMVTATEADGIADRLTDGDTLTAALRCVDDGRRADVRDLIRASGLDGDATNRLVPVLRAVAGAHHDLGRLDPVWTMPGHLAAAAPLTTAARRLVEGARQSVTCSTFNLQRSSGLWDGLRDASLRPAVLVRLYLDRAASEGGGRTPSAQDVADHLSRADVFRSTPFDGGQVRNHAKFVIVDHRFLLVTSANLSWSAEHANVELGLLVDDRHLAESIEDQMRRAEDHLFELVAPTARQLAGSG